MALKALTKKHTHTHTKNTHTHKHKTNKQKNTKKNTHQHTHTHTQNTKTTTTTKKSTNSGALLGGKKGVRAVKLKANARTDNECRRKKKKTKDRTQDPTSEAQLFYSNLNSPIIFPF